MGSQSIKAIQHETMLRHLSVWGRHRFTECPLRPVSGRWHCIAAIDHHLVLQEMFGTLLNPLKVSDFAPGQLAEVNLLLLVL